MADTTRKKTASFDRTTVSKDQNKEQGVETAKNPKPMVKSPKPPLPPRPPGLSKASPGKRNITPPKLSQHHKEKTLNANQDGHSRPRRPPPPSTQTSKTLNDSEQGNVKEVDNKTVEIVKAGTSENSLSTGNVSASQDIPEHENVLPNIPQVEANTDTKHCENICDVKSTQEKTEPNIPVAPKPLRPKQPKTSIESNPESKIDSSEKIQHSSVDVSGMLNTDENTTKSEKLSATHKTITKTPERPKPPVRSPSITTDDKLNTLNNDNKSSTAASKETPDIPKPHKVIPPVPPKPDSPRSAKKSQSRKTLDVVGKQSPAVQPTKSKHFAKPKVSEPASEIVKEKVVEKSGNFDVEISSKEETCSLENTSTEVVVPSETEKNCPQKNNVDKDVQEYENHAEVENDFEKERQEKTETSVAGSETLPRKEAKPSRPRLPSRKKEDAINELTSHNNSEISPIELSGPLDQSSTSKQVQQENNKVENTTTSLKPSRPCPPIRQTEDEKILKSCEDSTLLENIPLTPCENVQSYQVVAQEMQHEHSKAEKVASPKPLRPRAPSRKIKDDKIIHDNLTLQEDLSNCPEDQGSCKPVINEVEQKNNNTETTTPSKPSRPSKPTRPPPSPVATKDSENNLSLDEHESKPSKHQNDKPQRPLNPTLRTESVVVSDSTTDFEAQKNKPQRPSRPKLSSDAGESEEDIQKKDPELKHTDALKEITPTNKHDAEVDSNHSVKRTGSVKPCRPPEPSVSKHEISPQETSSSFVHTVADKSKPPRPQAPRHEKRITVHKQESVETSLKPREPNQEKGKKETPPKPKRTSISDRNALETQQSETDRDSEITKTKQTPVHYTEENKENLSKTVDSGETESIEVMENDNEGKVEVENILVANVKPKDTSNISGEDISQQLTSFDLGQPPSPNNDAQKDENISCIVAKQREKQDTEETLEDKKCNDRHNVRFRVSSLSKTEVESFNRKEFLENLKAKGYNKRSSEDNSAPQLRSKPARPRPPSTSKKIPGKDEHEDEVEEHGHEALHGNDALQATEHKKQASALEGENISEKSLSISDKPVDMVKQSETSEMSRINKVDNIPEPVASNAEKAQNRAGITGIDIKKCNDVAPEVKKKKVKRKAPPAPDEKLQDLVKISEKQTRKDEKNFTKPEITTGEKQIENIADNLDQQKKSETLRDTEDSTQCSEHTQQLVEEERNSETVEQPPLETGNNTGGCAEESNKDLNHVSSALENLSLAKSDSIKTEEMSQKDSLNNDVGKDDNIVKTEAINAVQSPKKKKTPPPKPKRTSSLKRDSKLIVPKREANEEKTTELHRNSSPGALNEIIEENNAGKSSTTALDENISQLKHPSNPVSRSKSFAFPAKSRAKETTGKNSHYPGGEERVSRSLSFSEKNKSKQQPTRPSPPTFFVTHLTTDESTNSEKVSEEASNDDVVMVKDTSSSQEDLVELEVPMNDTKHDSVLTTDSESESEKEPQKSKTYYISREILTTERTFVDVIKLVSEDFREAVAKGSKKYGRAIIPDETLHDIMMNISQIYDLDSAFLKALEDRMETWEKEQRIGDIIKTFSPFLKMYKTYIQGYDNAMAILTESLKKYPQFAEVVREFECSERCRNLTVGMYMLKPIQRIPSYRLLLMDYLKHLSKDSLDHKDVSDALAIVSEVATHINEDMKRVDNFEEVLKVQRSLVGQVEIVKPGRELIKEGALMKLSRKEMQPRMFYLFTDVLLYTTPVANNQFRLNLTLPLEEIEVELPVSPDFENEFSIIGTKKSFTLSASTLEERDEWLEALRNASDEIRKKKITFHLAKKEKMEALYDAQQREDDKEAQLGSKAPVWIPDARVTMCMLCTDDFTVTNRRHHCRACGKVVCGSCSSNSAPLAYLNSETARVCDVCYDELTDKTTSAQTVVKPSDGGPSADGRETPPKISAAKKNRRHTRFFKSKEVPAVEESTISGYLKTRVGKKWQKRWYVVKDNVLYASKASSDPAAQETRPLLGYDIRGPEKMDGDSKKIVFQLIHAGTEPVVLQTDNMKHGEQWVNALRRATILPM